MKKSLVLSGLLVGSVLLAGEVNDVVSNNGINDAQLRKEAKSSDLIPIPKDKTKLYKLMAINIKDNPITKEKVELGKKLYFEPRLSRSGLISCNTCHNLSMGGVDGIPEAVGHKWQPNPHHLNSPTVYNAVFFVAQFWDGRAPNLAEQAKGPSTAHVEMAATPEYITTFLNSIPEYVNEFEKAFNQKPSFELFTKAVAAFESTLITPSRYDDYLNGDDNALTPAEKKGLKTFIEVGCADCHSGVALGGMSMEAFPQEGKFPYEKVGDFKGNKEGEVKVPTLRNITETAPYYHNGTVWSLRKAVELMGTTQLGTKLTKEQVDSIMTFLKALDGRKPKIEIPQLPPRTDKTPKPSLDIKGE
jgi:cytochrome c peroxidase